MVLAHRIALGRVDLPPGWSSSGPSAWRRADLGSNPPFSVGLLSRSGHTRDGCCLLKAVLNWARIPVYEQLSVGNIQARGFVLH